MRHKRISRSPGATVLHAGDMDYGLTPAPDCRVPPANGSGRILSTRRFNEGWPAGCPLDDPSFAAFIADRFTGEEGAVTSLVSHSHSRKWERRRRPSRSPRAGPSGCAVPEVAGKMVALRLTVHVRSPMICDDDMMELC